MNVNSKERVKKKSSNYPLDLLRYLFFELLHVVDVFLVFIDGSQFKSERERFEKEGTDTNSNINFRHVVKFVEKKAAYTKHYHQPCCFNRFNCSSPSLFKPADF